MQNPHFYGVGGVVSADVAVPELEREVAFYSSVLTTGETPLWSGDLMNNLGLPIIGLGERTSEYENLPLVWMPHFQVADVAASVAKALELGGKVIIQDSQNRWAGLSDQFGVAFGIIPVDAEGVDASPDPRDFDFGRIAGLSLTTHDANSSCEFYEKVIGWKSRAVERDDSKGGTLYLMRMNNGEIAAEIDQRGDDGLEPVWLIHLRVGDLDESLRRVKAGGGEITQPMGARGFVAVRDPVGVRFALVSQFVDRNRFQLWLDEKSVPQSVREDLFLAHESRAGDGHVASLLAGLGGIVEYTDYAIFDLTPYDVGLIFFGWCPNGDPIAIDVKEKVGRILYVSHEGIDEDGFPSIEVSPSMADFLEKVNSGEMPLDYFEARR